MITQHDNKVNPYLNSKKSCLVISNNESGKSKKPTPEKLMSLFDLLEPFEMYDGTQKLTDFTDIIVCGGDGTISRAVDLCQNENHNIYYNPQGTVNDFGKISTQTETPILGKANGKSFCYVLATGTFTSIGYTAKRKTKKSLGRLAYIFEALKVFKVENIKATIKTEKSDYSGNYTLIMVLRSPRCFGFNFNKIYDPNKKELYLLLVEAPKNRISLFLKFFRCFFMGFNKKYDKHKIIFIPIEFADIILDSSVPFCLDGEKQHYQDRISVNSYVFDGKIKIKR